MVDVVLAATGHSGTAVVSDKTSNLGTDGASVRTDMMTQELM